MQYHYSGVLHIHTKYSDGSADINGVAKAASKSGVDFVLINDHDTLKGKYLDGEKYFQDVLVLVGSEVTPKRNHFLCCNIHTVPSKHLEPQKFVRQVYQQGGFGFLAHPDQKENPLFPGAMHWDNWDLDHPFGIEIWNYFAQWMGGFRTGLGLLISFLFPKAVLNPPQQKTLLLWDKLGLQRPVPVIAGVDAHGGRQLSWLPTILSSYKYQFRTLRTHILTEEPLDGNTQRDKHMILKALRKGHSYLVNYCAGHVKHFAFYLEDQGKVWSMGEEAKHRAGMSLNIKLEEKALIKVIKNGRLFSQSLAKSLRLRNPDPGVYRVEVFKGNFWPRPWIFSNHIYIRV